MFYAILYILEVDDNALMVRGLARERLPPTFPLSSESDFDGPCEHLRLTSQKKV